MRLVLIIVTICLGIPGCDDSRTKKQIQEEFEVKVSGSNDCSSADDCVIVRPDCPLGCGVAVNVEEKESVENLASKLVDEYGEHCDYSCLNYVALCESSKCVAEESQ